MVSMKKLMLGAAVLAGALGLGANKAQAAQIGVYVGGGPVAYVPPCPGPGYAWTAGYYAHGYWVPGRWAFVGVRGPEVGYGYYHRDRDDYYRHDRDDYYRHDRDFDRHHDRDRDRDRGWDRDHWRR